MSNIEEIQSIIVSWFNYAFYSQVWQKNQQEMFDSLRERGLPVKLGGDARCCSPGHTAKFGSYSLMNLDSSKVLDVQLVQVFSLSLKAAIMFYIKHLQVIMYD